MNVFIQSPDVKLSQQTRDNIKQKVLSGFSKFQNYVDRVELHIKDMNSPKDDNHKQCVIKLKGAKDESIIISGKAEDISHVVGDCINRAKSAIAKKVTMKRSRTRNRPFDGMEPSA
jgi:ribosome-associated translation inhibitor RaiA